MSTAKKKPRYLTIEEVERLKNEPLKGIKYYIERLKATEKKAAGFLVQFLFFPDQPQNLFHFS